MLDKFNIKLVCFASGLLVFGTAHAVTYAENFSGRTTQMDWKALGTACLTANGNGGNNTGAYASIPACPATIMPTPDKAGYGALRLTSNGPGQTGGILSKFNFPLSDGIQITFTTYTYNGSQDGPAGNGADGIAFMLTDGSAPTPVTTGGGGGSLGYSCSNGATVYDGMANAYLGLGIDEWGNFLNVASNTNTGIINTNSSFYPDKT
jgi:type IV pilus assembly protein PilY1